MGRARRGSRPAAAVAEVDEEVRVGVRVGRVEFELCQLYSATRTRLEVRVSICRCVLPGGAAGGGDDRGRDGSGDRNVGHNVHVSAGSDTDELSQLPAERPHADQPRARSSRLDHRNRARYRRVSFTRPAVHCE